MNIETALDEAVDVALHAADVAREIVQRAQHWPSEQAQIKADGSPVTRVEPPNFPSAPHRQQR